MTLYWITSSFISLDYSAGRRSVILLHVTDQATSLPLFLNYFARQSRKSTSRSDVFIICCCKQHSRHENINETLQRICLSDFETLKIYKITSYSLQWLSANIFVTTLACFFFLWFVSFFCLAIKKKEMNILFILNILLSIVRQSLTYYS